jgi:hypothetical protein
MKRFTDLVLLVGTNPLPNYVVGRYFLDHSPELQRIWLIYSEEMPNLGQNGTKDYADNIIDALHDTSRQFELVALSNVSSALQIKKNLSEKMFGKVDGNAQLHLNYTGGTKTMAVHVYQKLKQEFKERISFSYLDARSFRLKDDEQIESLSGDLRKEVFISMENLFKLHGYDKKDNDKKDNKEATYHETILKIEALIDQGNLDVFLNWQKNFARKIFYDDNGDFIKKTKQFFENLQLLTKDGQVGLTQVEIVGQEFNNKKDLCEIVEVIKTIPYPNILDEKDDLWIPDLETKYKDFCLRVKHPVEFLDGKWLDQYVYNVLDEAIRQDPKLKIDYARGRIDLKCNWKPYKKGSTKDFELDVILLYGYQVCGISCTTFQKSRECKMKVFEIFHRMKQIGGDESRMVLVSCLKDEDKMAFRDDLLTTTGSTKDNLLVLTKGDLQRQRLWSKIRQYLWGD